MTREEAIKKIKKVIEESVIFEDELEAFDMAIKALEQEPCADCISRQTVLDMLNDINAEVDEGCGFMYNHWMDYIEQLPTVSPQQKGGRWIRVDYDSNPNIGNWHCSLCQNISKLSNYCPNCGAKMEVE